VIETPGDCDNRQISEIKSLKKCSDNTVLNVGGIIRSTLMDGEKDKTDFTCVLVTTYNLVIREDYL
jgi:hypothetical protein